MDKTLLQGECLSFHISSIFSNSTFCQCLLFYREEVEAVLGVLREIDNPEISDEADDYNRVSTCYL